MHKIPHDMGKTRQKATLRCAVYKIEGAIGIRYRYPNCITDELIDVIATEDKILKYIDLPLQHSVGRVLSEMNRGESDSVNSKNA